MKLNDNNSDEAPKWVQDELAELSRPFQDLILKYGGNKAGSFVVMVNTKGAGIFECKPGVDVTDIDNQKKFLDEFLADMPSGKKGLFKDILKDLLGTFLPEESEPTEAQIQWVRDNAELIHKQVYADRPRGSQPSVETLRHDARIIAKVICNPCDCGASDCDKSVLFKRMTADLLAGQHPAG